MHTPTREKATASPTRHATRNGFVALVIATVLLALSQSDGDGAKTADLLSVLNMERTDINRDDLHLAAVKRPLERMTVIRTVTTQGDGTVVSAPLFVASETTVVGRRGDTARETVIASSHETLQRRVADRRLARIRTLESGGIAARPDVLVPKEAFPAYPSSMRAAAPSAWDGATGKEGQILMIRNGQAVWRDFPYLEQIRSSPAHGNEPTQRAGGRRSGGAPSSDSSSTTIIQQNTAAPSGWTDGDGVVYVTESSDRVGIGVTDPSVALEVAGTISGASLYVAGSFSGAGLADCDAATSKLVWDSTTGRFSCGTDETVGTGLSFSSGDARYVNVSGDTMTGALQIRVTGAVRATLGLNVTSTISGAVLHAEKTLTSSGNLVVESSISGAALYIASSINGAGLVDCDVAGTSKLLWDSTTGRFSCGTDTDTNTTYTAGKGLTLNGTSFRLNDVVTGSLLRMTTVSGSTVYARSTLASSGTLVWEGAASGASLWVSTFEGAGLTDCDLSTSVLKWDDTANRFSCGTATTAAEIGTQSFSGAVFRVSNPLYVSASGDTMTGQLVINVTGGNRNTLGLNVINAVSGAVIRGSKTLASSGTLVVEGAMSGASLYIATSVNGAGLTDCDVAGTSKLLWDSTTGRFSCGTDTDTNTTYTAGRGLGLNGTSFSLNSTITGALVRFTTVSGSTVYARSTLSSSGTLIVEGAMSGASLYVATSINGAGLTDCDVAGTSKLLWDSTTGRFSCGTDTDTNTTYTAGKGLTLNGTSFSLNDVVTGSLLRMTTVSGSTVYARTALRSSGTLVWEGAASGSSLYVATSIQGAGLTDCDLSTSVLRWDATTGRFSCGTASTSSYNSGNVLAIGDARYVRKSGDTMTGVLKITDKTTALEFGGTGERPLIVDFASGSAVHEYYIGRAGSGRTWSGREALNFHIATDKSFLWVSSNWTKLMELNGGTGNLRVAGGIASSGSLVWEGAATGASLYVATSINGAGLTDCDAASQVLKWDATTGRFSCGTASTSSYNSGNVLAIGDARYVKKSGDTMTGALTINVTGGNNGTLGLNVLNTVSGAILKAAKTLASSGTLVWEGAASGASLYVASSFQGAGLTDCDATGQTLNWDATTGRFVCGTDESAGSGLDQNTADARYVRKSGDTMTGTLTINLSSGSIGLKVLQTISGSTVHADRMLRSSGTLVTESGATIDGSTFVVQAGSNRVGIGTAAPADTVDVLMNSSTNATGISISAPANSGVGSQPALSFRRYNNGVESSRSYIASGLSSGNLADLFFATGIGTTPSTRMVITATGSVGIGTTTPRAMLEVAGGMSGAALFVSSSFSGAGLTDCDLSTQKLTWDSSTDRFGCSTLNAAPEVGTLAFSGAVIRLTDNRFVERSGDTMTGQLVINVTGGNRNTLGLNVINAVSGAVIRAQSALASSGTLVWEGAASGSSLYVASSLQGAGLVDCDVAGTSKLLWDSTTGRFSCGTDTDTNTTYTAGKGLTLNGTSFRLNDVVTGSLLRMTTVSGSTVYARSTLASSGTLVWEGAASGSSLYVATSIQGAGLTDCDAANQTLNWDATTGRFTCGADESAASGMGISEADARYVKKQGDTMTGQLVINITGGNANTIGLNVLNTVSGAVIHAEKTLTSSGDLVVEGTSVINGTFTANSTSRFNGNVAFTTNVLMGATGTPDTRLEVIGTVSGSVIRAQNMLASSGTLVWEGAASGASLYVASSINGAGLTDCDVAGTSKLLWDSTTGRFSCGTDTDTNTTYTAGRGLGLNGTSFSLNSTITGALVRFTTLSGSTVYARSTLTSSGTLVVEGAMSGASLYVATSINGAGLTDCDLSTSVLRWDATTGRFSCGTATTTAEVGTLAFSGAVIRLTDNRFVERSGDTMTGALTINVTGGNRNTLGLNVINAISGAVIRAQKTLTSSGNLVVESSISGASLYIATSINGAGLTDCDVAGTSKLLWDSTTGRFSCGTDQSGGGSGTPEVGTQSFSGAVIRLTDNRFVERSGDTMTGALTINVTGGNRNTLGLNVINAISGAVIKASKTLASSGTLIWEGAGSGQSLTLAGGNISFSLSGATVLNSSANNVDFRIAGHKNQNLFTADARGTAGTSTASGAIGIGTRTPLALLHVAGVVPNKTIASFSVSDDLDDIAVQGQHMFTAEGDTDVMRIYSISNVNSIEEITSLGGAEIDDPRAIRAQGQYVYLISNGTDTLKIIDVSDPLSPTVAGSIATADDPTTLAVHGRYAYVGHDASGVVRIYDISNPAVPVYLSLINIGRPVLALFVQGNYLYVTSSDFMSTHEINTYNVSNPVSPQDAMIMGTNNVPSGIYVQDRYAYVTHQNSDQIEIIDVKIPSSYLNGTVLAVGDAPKGVFVQGKYLFVTNHSGSSLQIVDVNSPTAPVSLGSVRTSGRPKTVVVQGRYAFVATESGNVQVFDVGGAYIQQFEAGGAEVATLNVRNMLQAHDGSFYGALNVSESLTVAGPGSFGQGVKIMSTLKVGSGALTVVAAEHQTGSYVYGSGAAVSALDAYTNTGSRTPHLLFGYRGTFDVGMYRIGRAKSGALVIRTDNTHSNNAASVFEIYSNAGHRNNKVFRVATNGSTFADGSYNSTGADYAEWFYAGNQKLEPGEVVCIDVTRNNAVKRCDRDADGNVMGIVSTNPAFIGNNISGADGIMPPGYALVGLIGQVPAKVTSEGGEIRPGDSLTAASKPGYARKAKAGESTVGVALEGMKNAEGTVNVLISRRNQSMTVEAVEEKILKTVASMEIEDEVQLMVSSALGDLNVDQQISTEVERQLSGMQSQQQTIEAIRAELDMLKEELARIRTQTGSAPAAVGSHLSASTMELDSTLTTGGDARVGGDLHIDGALSAASLIVPNGLTIDGGTVINGELMADLLTVNNAVVNGSITLNGDVIINGGLHFNEGALNVSDLIVENSLYVMGDLTIDGLATFLGDINVKGELIVSNKQAGFAMIPQSGTSVTVLFGTGFRATPVVTATPNGPAGSWWVSVPTQTGFVINVQEPVMQDTLFSWIALGTDGSVTIRAEVQDDGTFVFPLDSENVPVSSLSAWNACIRNIPMFDDQGQPLSCSRYHDGYTWTHPDLGITFIWNTSMTPAYLKVPDGYVPTVTESAESVENAFKPFDPDAAEPVMSESSSSAESSVPSSSAAAESSVSSSASSTVSESGVSSVSSAAEPVASSVSSAASAETVAESSVSSAEVSSVAPEVAPEPAEPAPAASVEPSVVTE